MDLRVDFELENLQRQTFDYFLYETNPDNGLVIDKDAENWPASIAATGLALACDCISEIYNGLSLLTHILIFA